MKNIKQPGKFRKKLYAIILCAFLFLPGCQSHDGDIPQKHPGEDSPGGNTETSPDLLFARNVSQSYGWYDVDKRKDNPEDIMACWLITACNMLQWWQDDYISAGNTLPPEVPNGEGSGRYQLAIFEDALDKFNDMKNGGTIQNALSWYITGETDHSSGLAYPKPGTGGYLKNLASRINFSGKPFLDDSRWERLTSDEQVLDIFSQGVIQVLRKGGTMGMDIKTQVGFGGGLHAITLWGVMLDKDQKVKNVYITDSDDYEKKLVCCPVFVYTDPNSSLKEVALKIPEGDAYTEGAEWSVIRLYSLYPVLP